ncbi:hypothetical protein [Nocardia noduli]|nr:hypothetical protein [Nocardia noduli]
MSNCHDITAITPARRFRFHVGGPGVERGGACLAELAAGRDIRQY